MKLPLRMIPRQRLVQLVCLDNNCFACLIPPCLTTPLFAVALRSPGGSSKSAEATAIACGPNQSSAAGAKAQAECTCAPGGQLLQHSASFVCRTPESNRSTDLFPLLLQLCRFELEIAGCHNLHTLNRMQNAHSVEHVYTAGCSASSVCKPSSNFACCVCCQQQL
jgi:hypothetical protein